MISPIKRTNSQWWNAYDESKEMVSDYWMEISQEKLHVCGNAYYIELDSTASYYQTLGASTAELIINAEIWRKLNEPSIGIDWKEYDKWKDSVINNEKKFFYQPDGNVDFIYKIHKSTGGILSDVDGFSALSWYSTSVSYEVDLVNHIKVDYGYSENGSGATVIRNAEKKRIFFAMSHEHGHFLYANGHITYGKVAYGPGSELNFSPYEQILFGYAKYSTANLNNQNTYTIGDYSGRDTTYNQFLIVPIDENQSFAIANRGNLSRWDRVMFGDTARILMTDLNTDYGKGAYIYHFKQQPVAPIGDQHVQDLECADGMWHWTYKGRGQYYAFDKGYCWDGGSVWMQYQRDSVLYDNDNGWNDSAGAKGDDKSFWIPQRFSIGSNNSCGIGTEKLFTNNEEFYSNDPHQGDRWDPWNVGYNEVFSPYSSPSTKTMTNGNSNIYIYLCNNNNSNHSKTFNIYRTGYNGMTDSIILSLTPPSRPMGLKIAWSVCTNGVRYPQISWNHNMEPDMTSPFFSPLDYKRYKIFRAYTDMNNVPGDYEEVADQYFNANTTPTWIDYNASSECSFGQSESRYNVRYKIKAVDNYNTQSVYSEFVSTQTLKVRENNGDNFRLINSDLPKTFFLNQNYPNPFNPVTNIKYDLPKDVFVSIKIYDLLGREIKTLVSEFKQAGSYLVSFNGSEFASGIYFYKIQAGSFTQVKRMVLVK